MKSTEPVAKTPGRNKAQTQKNRRMNDALAELIEMLHEAHAGQFSALGHGLAGYLDGFLRFNHDGRPAPIFRLRDDRLPG